jgi:phage terminase large subunit-like protein
MNRDQLEMRARELDELVRRRTNDPLRNFKPHTKQQEFIDAVLSRGSVEGAQEFWMLAANRSGKSDAGAYVGATLARFGFPGSPGPTSGWVSALDFATSRDVIQPKYFDNGFVPPGQPHPPFIPKHEIADWRVDDQILKLKNGSIIGFKSADSGRRKYQGAEKDWVHFDEEHPWELYEEAVIRVGARPLTFFCTATILPPEGIKTTASWIFGKIVQPFQDGRLKHVQLFGASIYDNPGISRDEIRRLEAIYPEGSIARRIRLEGELLPGLAGARAYPAFDRLTHVGQAPEVTPRWPLLWTWDFNVQPMCSLVLQQHGRMYWVKRELVLPEGNIPDLCEKFYMMFPNHDGEVWIYGDATGNKRTGQTGKTDYWTILNEMKSYGCPLRLKILPDNPKVPDRINAVNRLLRDEDGAVRLKVDHSCQELIEDLEGVLRSQTGGILKITNRKDPYFNRTHTSDALGYLVNFEEPVRPPSDRSTPVGSIPRPKYNRG